MAGRVFKGVKPELITEGPVQFAPNSTISPGIHGPMTVKVPQPKIRTIVNKILHPISTDVNAIELVIGREDTIEISYKEPGAIQRSTNVAQVNPQRPSSHH